jgi:hypothetical protein
VAVIQLRYHPEVCLERLGKVTKISDRIDVVLAKIRPDPLMYINLQYQDVLI